MHRSIDPSLPEELFAAATMAANVVFSPLTRPWYASWGATAEEVQRPLPGDELVPTSRLSTTRAITVRAPADAIWPWLVQLGQARGGLYTFQRLENLAGCQIENVGEIRQELQELAVGDVIRLGPEGYPSYTVAQLIDGRALILKTNGDDTTTGTWAFYLEPEGDRATRLLARSRLEYAPSFANRLIWRGVTDPIFFVMERRMLIGIRDRSEALFNDRQPGSAAAQAIA